MTKNLKTATWKNAPHAFLFVLASFLAASCAPENAYVAPPPPEVDVAEPDIRDTTVFLEFPGRTEAFETVEIRARVQGFLKKKLFQPGQYVTTTMQLFTIEPEEFDAAVTAAQGNLDKAKADFELAKTNAEKQRDVFEKSAAVSEINVLSAEAEMEGAAATTTIRLAELKDAVRNLGYTKIFSPSSGRVSRNFVDPGNLVGASDPTLLTTVVQDDPVFVNFEVSERAILPYLKKRPGEGEKELRTTVTKDSLELVLSNGEKYSLKDSNGKPLKDSNDDEISVKGNFDFLDNAIDPNSGTMQVRAIFDNKEGELASGLFVRIRIPQPMEQAVHVPRLAVQRDLGGSFVLVVGEKNIVERRIVVQTQFTYDDLVIIEPRNEEENTGLSAGERIVVSNLQRARAGIAVAPKTAEAKTGGEDEKPAPAGKKESPGETPAPKDPKPGNADKKES